MLANGSTMWHDRDEVFVHADFHGHDRHYRAERIVGPIERVLRSGLSTDADREHADVGRTLNAGNIAA
jgi:hypothetical protein